MLILDIFREVFDYNFSKNLSVPIVSFNCWELTKYVRIFSSVLQTIEIARKFVNLHGSFAAKIHDLMEHAVKTGEPVNRPLWWIDPTDPICLTIDTGIINYIHLFKIVFVFEFINCSADV